MPFLTSRPRPAWVLLLLGALACSGFLGRLAAAPAPAGELGCAWPDTPIPIDGAGDEAAFVVVFREIQPRLLRYLRTLCGADAEDIAAEAWVQVVRGLDVASAGP